MTTVYTLNVDHYAPEITSLTYPYLTAYAEKIGAAFHVIDERKSPDFPPVYEKLQIYDLARQRGDDWSIYIDSDALVHPDFFDPTNHLQRDTVAHNGRDMAGNRWRYDDYFRRDGRHIGSCNWLAVASSWCRDLWHPLEDLTLAEALARIYPTANELRTVITRDHLIDDYVLSRNIARFGLKHTTIMELQRLQGDEGSEYLWHQYTLDIPAKVEALNETLLRWFPANLTKALAIEGYMTPAELGWLAQRARGHQKIVEIGSYYGRSTRALADHAAGAVLALDDWYGPRDVPLAPDLRPGIFARFTRHLADHLESGRVSVQKIDYADLPGLQLSDTPDMVFIDGSHEHDDVVRDLRWALDVLAPGGLICGHDYTTEPGVASAVLDVLGPVRSGADSIWWATRG